MRRLVMNLVLLLAMVFAGGEVCAATIDIMVLFDTTAKSWADGNGGMQNIATAAVAKMNMAASNSGIANLNFNLVNFQQMSGYTTRTTSPSGSLDDDLNNLSSASGGLSSVPSLRATYGADLVALLVDTGSDYGIVGIGYELASPAGQPDFAYTVCAIRAVVLDHTLTHEVGHNLGADHSKYQVDSPGPNYALNSYSAGWYFTGTNGVDYHTIMAYNFDGANYYDEAPYFSTPNRSYMGTVAGDAQDGDNARTINDTKDVVAAYRSASVNKVCAPPSLISVPTTDADGNYLVSWGASATSGAGYTLEEAANSLFTSGLRTAYTGAGTSVMVTGKAVGTYFYRVKASAAGYTDSPWLTGANACTVSPPQAAPPTAITVPATDEDGNYEVHWEASLTAGASYVLEEAGNSTFTSGLRTAYAGSETTATMTGREKGAYFYRVKARAAGYADSAWRSGTNGCVVTLPEAVPPASISVPDTDDDGSYPVSWEASVTFGASYLLEEARNRTFTLGLRTAYTGSGTVAMITGRSSGAYYYRVRAGANGYSDSSWQTGANGCTVTLSPPVAGAPASITVPASDEDGSYTVSWEASSTPGAIYTLEEARDSAFAGSLRMVYTGTAIGTAITGRSGGTYYYRVKAGASGYSDSPWRAGSNGCAVTINLPAANPPVSISVPVADDDGNFTVSWGASGGFGETYVLEEAANRDFTQGLVTVYRGAAASVTLSGRVGGTYYYRLKTSRIGYADSNWLVGGNGCTVLPQPPQLTYSVEGLTVTASWTAVPGSDGYTLFAAPYPYSGADSIISIDMEGATSLRASLWAGAAYYVAVKARNAAGSSDYSNIQLVSLGTP